MITAKSVQNMFTFMPERRVTDVMAQGNCLDQIFIQSQKASCCSGDSGDQLHMQHTMCDVVIVDQRKNLGFVDIAGIRL